MTTEPRVRSHHALCGCVASNKTLHLAQPQFPHLEHGEAAAPTSQGLLRNQFIPGRTREGFLEEAVSELGLERWQEPGKGTLGLHAKPMDDRSEKGFWKPYVAAASMLKTSRVLQDSATIHGLGTLGDTALSPGSLQSESNDDLLRVSLESRRRAPLKPWLFPEAHSLPGQFSSVAQSCPTLCHPTDCSTPGLPVHHQLPEFTQIHIH